jgi:hypothetical protein
MNNRGKDSWNKAMLTQKKQPAPTKNEPVPEIRPEEARDGAVPISPPKVGPMPGAWSPEKSTKVPERNYRNTAAAATHPVVKAQELVSTNTDMRGKRKTPLQEFDVRAFFEENLFDIIDLEENRSGIREFEDALKQDD